MTNLSSRQQIGRAKNAVSLYLTRKLSVPKIFLDADWNHETVDLLAIDRAGVGDVHAIRLLSREENEQAGTGGESVLTTGKVSELIDPIQSLPSQYKYIGIASHLPYPLQLQLSRSLTDRTFAEDGIGRVGILFIDTTGDDLRVEEIVKPERFRSSKQILQLADEYVATHTANMEYRDPADFEVHV